MSKLDSLFGPLILLGELVRFGLLSIPATVASIASPGRWVRQWYAILIGALPPGAIAGVSLGAVVWLQTHHILARTGTEEYLPTALAVAVLLELAPIAAGLIVAARTGASIGAELGAMKNSEQIDALEMIGISPRRELVGPRIIGAMLALPMLHVLIASLAVGSGYLADTLSTGSGWLHYKRACLSELYLGEVLLSGAKTVVLGALIGATACFFGLRSEGGTQGVGRATTISVVWSMILVLVADVAMVFAIQAILAWYA